MVVSLFILIVWLMFCSVWVVVFLSRLFSVVIIIMCLLLVEIVKLLMLM